jgi:hypothetical protein
MNQKILLLWFSTISGILVFFGILYSVFGLIILPVNNSVLLHWESALYGAIMMGWGVTLFLIGLLAFRRNDTELMKVMLLGIFIWLVVEASFSAYLGVLFNVGVDIGVFVLFSAPLILGIRYLKEKQNSD